MEKVDLVLQGAIQPFTIQTAEIYLTLDWVNNVIISCWESCGQITNKNPRIIILQNKDVENGSTKNRNRQIVSSREGIKKATTQFVYKFRSDQIIHPSSLQEMHNFYVKYNKAKVYYEDNLLFPRNRICVGSIFTQFPFHPKDWWFLGNKEDLLGMLDIPLDLTKDNNEDYTKTVRSETYLFQFYCAKFDKKVREMVDNPQLFLYDNAPRFSEALQKSSEILQDIYKVMPPVHFLWPKYFGDKDVFHFKNGFDEYYHNEELT